MCCTIDKWDYAHPEISEQLSSPLLDSVSSLELGLSLESGSSAGEAEAAIASPSSDSKDFHRSWGFWVWTGKVLRLGYRIFRIGIWCWQLANFIVDIRVDHDSSGGAFEMV